MILQFFGSILFFLGMLQILLAINLRPPFLPLFQIVITFTGAILFIFGVLKKKHSKQQ